MLQKSLTLSNCLENDESYKEIFEIILEKEEVKKLGTVLFGIVAGSVLYNLSKSYTSDVDIILVYISPSRNFLGMNPFKKENFRKEYTLLVKKSMFSTVQVDILGYEIGSYLRKLCDCDPVSIEMLLGTVEKNFENTIFAYNREYFLTLREKHSFFLRQNLLYRYLGWSRSHFEEFKRTKNLKKCYHAFRLVYEARNVSIGRLPIVYFPENSNERKRIMEIRNSDEEKINISKITEEYRNLVNSIKENQEKSLEYKKMIKNVNQEFREWLNEYLVKIRLDQIKL